MLRRHVRTAIAKLRAIACNVAYFALTARLRWMLPHAPDIPRSKQRGGEARRPRRERRRPVRLLLLRDESHERNRQVCLHFTVFGRVQLRYQLPHEILAAKAQQSKSNQAP